MPSLIYDLGSLLALDSNGSMFRKSVDQSKLTITSVLTYPEEDKAGDYVHPDGGNFEPHRANPWVGLEHWHWHKSVKDAWVYPTLDDGRPNPDTSGEPVVVAWARDSLDQPGGKYDVRMVELTLEKGEKATLPVGTSYFDASDKLSSQVFALVANDSLPGVSVEIKPSAPRYRDGRLHKSYRPRGHSSLENRPALEVFNWDCHGYVFCRVPINDGALSAVPEKLVKALQIGKVGSEPMHPLLLKSMSAVIPSRRYFNVANTILKADQLPDQNLADTSVYDDASPAEGSQSEPAGNYPTADALRILGQTLTDACEAARGTKGEHKKGMKQLAKLCDKVEAIVQEAIAAGDNVESDLSDDEDAEVEATEDEAAAVSTDTDDDGLLKCLPARLKLILKAKRFKLAEIQAAELGNTPDDRARLEKARRKYKRAEAIYS